MKWIILILGIAANASASIMVKYAMMPPHTFPSLADPMAALRNWPFWLGLVLYGGAFLLYAASLSRFPLNVAHPLLTSGTITVIALFSALVLREPFHWTIALGIILVILGVTLIASHVG